MTILSIESSCDDTGASVIENGVIKSNVVASQKIHELYGGVVPEVASRQHHLDIVPVVVAAMDKAGKKMSDLGAIGFTKGPGLLGSLLVGVSFAKGLALSLKLPLIEVHHMHAHILAHFIEEPKPEFPFICLTVSGGHTQIVLVKSYLEMMVLGQTIDDAAGEAFDKTGKMFGLKYPAGPEIDNRALRGEAKFEFAQPVLPGLDFSFSGFKTSVLYFLQKEMAKDPGFTNANLNDLCASVQKTIIMILMKKLKKAVTETRIKRVAIAGGVAANSGLRAALEEMKTQDHWDVFIPSLQFCTDNAGMIALVAWVKYQSGDFADLSVSPDPRMPFPSLNS
ncbi:MAG: tRNA (adenosine(37)-N6)-threonylcarbamoyltransferase complex transferase subunit TsaD [Saprospiraceae bacterium]|nr:tRNA (adenosine(37)-N6)-threonylcarbamoyltransferase complex transferase subunit TsaD [Saprospiraceae bacterium]